jgi:hypothetical protein
MRKLPMAAALFLVFTISSSALAAGYGAAGCGFGGSVIEDNRVLPQIGAWFLNSLLGNQTFGITSGTSDCGQKKGGITEKDQTLFVEINYHSLAKEMAAGEGEGLQTLSGLLGCPEQEARGFAAFTKQNYPSIFHGGNLTPAEMLSSLKKELSDEPVFATSCTRI